MNRSFSLKLFYWCEAIAHTTLIYSMVCRENHNSVITIVEMRLDLITSVVRIELHIKEPSMIWLINLLAGIALAYLFAFTKSSAWLVATLIGVCLAINTFFSMTGYYAGVLIWGLFAAITALLLAAPLRRNLLTNKIFAAFKKVMPEISQTEQEAIDAGTVWWDADLFTGNPEWQKLLSVPKAELTQDEQDFLDGPVEVLCGMIDEWKICTELNEIPDEIMAFIREHRLFGMIIPKQYGGLEFSAYAHSQVVIKIATRSNSVAVLVMVPNSLGPAELLMHYGTQEQRDHYLPRLAVADEIPAFGLTGPNAGSDAASVPDEGIVCMGEHDGHEVLGMRVTWEKRYITLGPICTVLGLAFQVKDPDKLLGNKEDLGITCALIPSDTPGVFIGNRHMPLNAAFPNGPNAGKDVFIPMNYVIGGVSGVGEGWKMLMGCLAAGRSISLPALGTAAGKASAVLTGVYARTRKQFNTPIAKFEGIEEPLARIAGYAYMMDAARILTAHSLDLGEKPTVISAILKLQNTEHMRIVLNDTMDILGGKGICMGPNNPIGRNYQAIPIGITVEGANILTRSLIVFGQGAIRCHPEVLNEMQAIHNADPVQGAKDFDKAFMGHLAHTFRNLFRSLFYAVGGSRIASSPVPGPMAQYYKDYSRLSANFAITADLCMAHLGGSLKKREKTSARLGDCLSFLYMGSAVLKRFEDTGRPEADLPLAMWAAEYCRYRVQNALTEICDNYPTPLVGTVMRRICFPFGAAYKHPHDDLGKKAAAVITTQNAARDRLAEGVYLAEGKDEMISHMNDGFDLIIKAESVEKKFSKAMGRRYNTALDEALMTEALNQKAVTPEEADLIRRSAQFTRKIIMVDDFSPEQARNGWHEAAPFDSVFSSAEAISDELQAGKYLEKPNVA